MRPPLLPPALALSCCCVLCLGQGGLNAIGARCGNHLVPVATPLDGTSTHASKEEAKEAKVGEMDETRCQEALAEAKAKAAARALAGRPRRASILASATGAAPAVTIGTGRDDSTYRACATCASARKLIFHAHTTAFSPPLAVLRHRALTATQCARTVASRCSHRRQCNKCGAKHPTKAPPPPRAADRKADQAMGLDTGRSYVSVGGADRGQKRTGEGGGFREFDEEEEERRKRRALVGAQTARPVTRAPSLLVLPCPPLPVHLREADVLYLLRWPSQEERKEKEERKAEKKKCEFCKRFACIC